MIGVVGVKIPAADDWIRLFGRLESSQKALAGLQHTRGRGTRIEGFQYVREHPRVEFQVVWSCNQTWTDTTYLYYSCGRQLWMLGELQLLVCGI